MTNNIYQLIEQSSYRGTKRVILHKLARLALKKGFAYCSVGTLASSCGISERTTQYHLAHLKRDGVLRIDYEAGQFRENHYYLNDLLLASEGDKRSTHKRVTKPAKEGCNFSQVEGDSSAFEEGDKTLTQPRGFTKNIPRTTTTMSNGDGGGIVSSIEENPKPSFNMEDVQQLISKWNALPFTKKFLQPAESANSFKPGSVWAGIVAFCNRKDWLNQWERVLRTYSNSPLLRTGGDSGNLNSLDWLFVKGGLIQVEGGRFKQDAIEKVTEQNVDEVTQKYVNYAKGWNILAVNDNTQVKTQ